MKSNSQTARKLIAVLFTAGLLLSLYPTSVSAATRGGGSLFYEPERIFDGSGDPVWSSQISVDSRGVSHVVWVASETGTRCEVFYSKAVSGSFSEPIMISDDPGDDRQPKMALDSAGNCHIVWCKASTEDSSDIYYVNNSSGSFSIPVKASGSVGVDIGLGPDIAIDSNNNCHVVWNFGSLYYTQNSSGSFSEPIALTDAGFQSYYETDHRIAVDRNNHVHVAWNRFNTGTDGDVFYTNNTSGTFMKPVNVSQDQWNNRLGGLDVDPRGNAHLVWAGGYFGSDESLYGTNICYSNNKSGSFSYIQFLEEGWGVRKMLPSIRVDENGNAHAIWYGYPCAISYSNDVSGEFSEPIDICDIYGGGFSDGVDSSCDFEIDADGFAHIVWSNNDRGNDGKTKNIFYIDNKSGSFDPKIKLSHYGECGQNWLTPDIALDCDGNSYVVWDWNYGEGSGVYFCDNNHPSITPVSTWYLAEGCTNDPFESWLMVQNPNSSPARVQVQYMRTDEMQEQERPAFIMPPQSRRTLDVGSDAKLSDVSTMVVADRKIVCERSMYWNNRIDGHNSIGVVEPANEWYLAEGHTSDGFETWVLIQNPGDKLANVDITYMTQTGPKSKDRFQVAPDSRTTVMVNQDVPAGDVSTRVVSDEPIIAERSMYWDERRGGHDSIGVTEPATEWYLAEGSTNWGYDTWVLIQNPSDKNAKVEVEYMTTEGLVEGPRLNMATGTRRTIHVDEQLPGSDFSTRVTSDQPVIAERAMYWDNGTGRAGHDSIGVTDPKRSISFAEGSTDWGFETYVLIQNPNGAPATVNVTYMTPEGPVARAPIVVGARSRANIYLNEDLPNRDVSIQLSADRPIMAERAMYWNKRGGGHDSIGYMK